MDAGLRMLIVGNADSVGWAPPTTRSCAWWAVPTLRAAMDWLGQSHVDLIVLASPRRGIFHAPDVERLSACAPLSRVVVLAGPWCEGPWRRDLDRLGAAPIVPWHRWPAWLRSNAAQLRRDLPAAWSLPAAAGIDELAEFWAGCRLPQRRGLVAVHSPSRDAAEALGDMLALGGYASYWQSPGIDALVQGAAAHVFEVDGWTDMIAAKIESLRGRSADLPAMLLLNFPLPADIQAARAAGAGSVLGKPFTLHEFLGQLGELLPRAQVPQEEAA